MFNYRMGSIAMRSIALCVAATPLLLSPNTAFAQAVKMSGTFKNVSNQNANDFHLETSLFILKNPAPTSTKFTRVKVIGGTGEADFDMGNVAAGAAHTVDWTASGKKSKLVDHYFTFNGSEISNSSKLVALTQEFNSSPGTYSMTNFNETDTSLSGLYSVYAKPVGDFYTSSWNDLGDATFLSSSSYTVGAGGSEAPQNFSITDDQYLLLVGTANDGETTENFSSAFSATVTVAPEPGSLALAGMVIVGGLRARRRRSR